MRPPERRAFGGTSASLGEALAWLDRHINLEAIERGVAGRAAAPTLERVAALLSAMGDPQHAAPAVHVTGTNGKGSTTRMVAALLRAKGLCVGTYTSPHLEVLNERIARDGVPIGDEELGELLWCLADLERFLLRRGLEPPTWFELVTAAAFRYFADVAVDAAVIEVGLGGRFDATNVVDAAVAAVTNVELDHVEILGPTRAHIAAEKAGIIKPGSIACVGEEDPDLVEIFAAEARAVGAQALWRRGVDFDCSANRLAVGGRLLDLRTPGRAYDGVFLPLHGSHQGANAALALACAEAFFGAPLDDDVVGEGLASVRVPGRLEVVGHRPLVVLDGAHNVAGASALGAALAEDFAAPDGIVALVGCLRGREPGALLEAIGTERLRHVVACAPSSPRAIAPELVAEAARRLEVPATVAESVDQGLEEAVGRASVDDLVLVTGSLYVVGSARGASRRLASHRR
ncbi:MAG TPA: Mur ligase family protein [Acidimicrobiales bacterium]|nr:Mur ligase family protein [Acidimicrobiales bacterium]